MSDTSTTSAARLRPAPTASSPERPEGRRPRQDHRRPRRHRQPARQRARRRPGRRLRQRNVRARPFRRVRQEGQHRFSRAARTSCERGPTRTTKPWGSAGEAHRPRRGVRRSPQAHGVHRRAGRQDVDRGGRARWRPLRAWSGGQTSAAEVSDILAKAMLGETDGLKQLGISISQDEVNTASRATERTSSPAPSSPRPRPPRRSNSSAESTTLRRRGPMGRWTASKATPSPPRSSNSKATLAEKLMPIFQRG